MHACGLAWCQRCELITVQMQSRGQLYHHGTRSTLTNVFFLFSLPVEGDEDRGLLVRWVQRDNTGLAGGGQYRWRGCNTKVCTIRWCKMCFFAYKTGHRCRSYI